MSTFAMLECVPLSADKRPTDFDKQLHVKWTSAPTWYDLDDLTSRQLTGRFGFVVQLNAKRDTLRRPPDTIQDIRQPFDEEKFNFTKVGGDEILLRRNEDVVAVNVSPIEDCHSLVIPKVNDRLPQILTRDGLNFALDIFFESGSPDFRAGFNSLGAFASVNHQHLHIYYLRYRLYLETAPVEATNKASVFKLLEYPARGLMFLVKPRERDSLMTFFKVIDVLLDNNIAHNVFITRGTLPAESTTTTSDVTTYNGVRVYLWA